MKSNIYLLIFIFYNIFILKYSMWNWFFFDFEDDDSDDNEDEDNDI